jgi:hypothetical protein
MVLIENKDMDFMSCPHAQCNPSSTELVQCSNFCTEQVRTFNPIKNKD